ncbi:hypothetical protein BDZ90DRAFT_230538 [Jaminaea rosea]|uniref:Mediator of RNA polymerase II transcription subunit 13 n=1 Tax=Jaminaea rosea TaxID=1569628 RepID=A0A316UWK2_9BASI|nr:hypothetical protein BDZ90DRAFT_230538 [Jaminaea rosea]PWN29676.1 hypothetical protein BDZ90DRAFT_230538 [Jaminaea rosea]
MSIYRSSSSGGGVGVVSPLAGPSSSRINASTTHSSPNYQHQRYGMGSPLAESRETLPPSQQASTSSLPPTVSKAATTSIISIPLPNNARIALQRLEIDEEAKAAQLLQQLKALTSYESSYAARRWALSEGAHAKGKGRAAAWHEVTGWPSEILHHTLWHFGAEQKYEAPASAGEDNTSSTAQKTCYLFTFFKIQDLPHRSQHLAPAKRSAEDDLWGESPAATSPEWGNEDGKALAELAERIEVAKSSLANLLSRLPEESCSSCSLVDTTTSSQDGALQRKFCQAVQASLANTFVWRSRAHTERQLFASAVQGGVEDFKDCKDEQMEEDEDGEIKTEEVATAAASSDDRRPTLCPRRAVRAGSGFFMAPYAQRRVLTEADRIAFGEFQVTISPRLQSDELDGSEGQPVLFANLTLDQTTLATLDHHHVAGGSVELAPTRRKAYSRGPPPETGTRDESTRAAYQQLCAVLEIQTGIAADQLMEGGWLVVQGGEDDALTFLWPRQLCFSKRDAVSSHTASTLRNTAMADLLEATTEVLAEQKKPASQESPSSPARPAIVVDEAQEEEGDITLKGDKADAMDEDVTGGDDGDDGDGDDGDLFGSDDGDADADGVESTADRGPSPALLVSRSGGSDPSMSRRPSRGEVDDSMYGLVTEDDFAFFDDIDGDDEADAGVTAPAAPSAAEKLPDTGTEAHAPTISDQTQIMDEDIATTHVLSRLGREVNTSTSSTSGIPSDPSSLPGFTPGSYTDSSPATGGPHDQTPRTPTSPYYDVRPIPTVDGWTPHQDAESTPRSAAQMSIAPHAFATAEGASHDDAEPDSNRKLKDLRDKYSSGKFALPNGLANGGSGGGGGATRLSRIARAAEGQSDTAKANATTRRQLRLVPRTDDEMSDVGTHDGSSDEESGDSDEEDEYSSDMRDNEAQRPGEAIAEVGRMLDASMALIRSIPAAAKAPREAAIASSVVDDSAEQMATRQTLIDWLLDNPFLRAEVHGSSSRGFDDADSILPLLEITDSACQAQFDVELLEAPSVFVGCQGSITEMAPSALRFWEKLGLSAAGGQRRIVGIVLHHSSCSPAWRAELSQWLSRLSTLFSSLGLGSHEAAHDALIELGESPTSDLDRAIEDIFASADQREDTVRSLVSRFAEALGPDRHVVLYAVGATPTSSLVALQRDLRVIGAEKAGLWSQHIHVRPLPWSSIKQQSVKESVSALKVHALALYNTLRVAVEFRPVRSTLPTKMDLRSFPAFTLAAPCSLLPSTSQFTLSDQPHPAVFTRQGWLHVCYHAGQAGELSFLSIMDGEGKDRALKSHCSSSNVDIVRWVSQQTQDYMRRRGSLWHVAIFKKGSFTAGEATAWDKAVLHAKLRCESVSILSYQDNKPFFATHKAASESIAAAPASAVLVDSSQVSHAIYPDRQMLMTGTSDDIDDNEDALMSLQSSIVNSTARAGRTHSAWIHLVRYRQATDGKIQTNAPPKLIRLITQSLMGLRIVSSEHHLGLSPWPMAAIEAVDAALRHYSLALSAPVATPATAADVDGERSSSEDVMA